jgi:hypothetical protein
VLHFGTDDCNRLLVLRSVGYSVNLCPTVEEFHSLMQKRTGADAILVAGVPVRERRQVVTLTRERSHAPLVLFNTSYDYADEGKFDLVIPPLTRPEEWLRKIAATIDQAAFRVLATSSSAIRRSTKRLSLTIAGSSGDRSADCSTWASVERRISTRLGDASTMYALDAAIKGRGRTYLLGTHAPLRKRPRVISFTMTREEQLKRIEDNCNAFKKALLAKASKIPPN